MPRAFPPRPDRALPPSGPVLPPIPPRPDGAGSARRSPRRWVTVAAIGGVLLLAAGIMVAVARPDPAGSVDRSRPSATPSQRPTALPSTSSSPSPAPDDPVTFRFFETDPLGRPVAWEQCEITYRAFVADAPAWGMDDVEESFRRLGAATGFEFTFRGTSSAAAVPAVVRMDRRRVTEGADIVIAWLPHRMFVDVGERLDVRGHPIAWASAYWSGGRFTSVYGGALVVVDLRFSGIPGFEGWWSHGATLLHELGHAMGLGHVRDRNEIMYGGHHPDLTVDDFGNGDLEGLRRAGAPERCAS